MTGGSPWQVLQGLLRTDAAAPRLTFYERTPGPTNGERIELSGKVLANWVSKAANALSEEYDVTPESRVGVFLPAAHWRTAYWSLAAWALGAGVEFVDADQRGSVAPAQVDVLVTSVPEPSFGGAQIIVTPAMLARAATLEVPAGALDEAKELSTFADVFSPFSTPPGSDVALVLGGREFTFREIVAADAADAGRRVYLPHPDPAALMAAWSAGGGVVLVRGDVAEDELHRILAQENLPRVKPGA